METPGFGTKVGYSDTLGGSYTDIAEVVDVKPAEAEVSDIDTTHMQSTNKWKTFQAGLKEAGTTDITIHFDKTLYATLKGFLGDDKFYQVTYSDGSTEKYAGYLKKIGPETPIDGITTVKLTFKLSGEPTYTPAA